MLDLSSNEFSAEGVGVIADATRNAAGLKQLRLLGNKIPFGLDTLRQLMQVRLNGLFCYRLRADQWSACLPPTRGVTCLVHLVQLPTWHHMAGLASACASVPSSFSAAVLWTSACCIGWRNSQLGLYVLF